MVRGAEHALEEELAAAAQVGALKAVVEDQRVAEGPPEDGHQTGAAEALGTDREHVLLADEAAVEERQGRAGSMKSTSAALAIIQALWPGPELAAVGELASRPSGMVGLPSLSLAVLSGTLGSLLVR